MGWGRCRPGLRRILTAHRRRVGEPLDLGVRALNTFVTVCRGQHLLGLRCRQVGAFVDAGPQRVGGHLGDRSRRRARTCLGAAGLARSVVVVSTSDEPALMRRQAAYLMLAIAEYFRDLGKDVLVLMDSVTRFAMAQREIGLSAGEPPTAKGYTPTVFVELPRLLERAGPERSRALSPVFSACLWMVTITMNPSPMRFAVSSMVTSSWSARSPSAVAILPSTF